VLAIAHCHEKGIVYRDLKPENVMVSLDGHLLLTDFGLSKQLGDPSATPEDELRTRTVCGTSSYMAPEALSGRQYGRTVDWSTLLPVFVSLEALLSTMTHPGMTLKGFILYRDESFRMVCEIVTTCALWTRLFWRYRSRLRRFFASIRLERSLRQGMPLMLTRSLLVMTLVARIRLIPLCLVVIRIRLFRLMSMSLRRNLLR
jgi:serine/threonine protein kinase